MRGSSLFSLCPACGVRANIQHVQAAYRCASCHFDFSGLANDPAALDRWLDANLRDGSEEMTITLHHLITGLPEPESRARVLAFAAQRDIARPKSGVSGLVAIAVAIAVLLVAVIGVVFFVAR